MNIFFFTFTLISITTMALSATLDVYDFDSTIEYPYKSIIISSEESFDKYDSGIPMNRGDMLFYEANGSIQLINNEVVLYYAPKGVVAKLSKDYIEKLNLGSITPFEDLPSPPVGFQDPEELPRDQAISEFLAFYEMKVKEKES
ncbi:uncharacterized protein RJT21DRAFT_121756 [Scheffersomyces amazonensis]|uniref:uncharacterized protein n=1 Tax=Scheffersomyces amazonensis TaxID=1078765 RepID=UPI00315CC4D1